MSTSSAAQPSVVLQNLSAIGTFAAALATTVIVAFTLVQLRLLRRQLEAARAQAAAAAEAGEAAREAVDASRAAVVESARVRVDERAPRVIALMEAPQWPALVDNSRSGMPLANEMRLWHHRSVSQSYQASPSKPFVFDRDRGLFLWFRVHGVLVNEGAGTARVRLDGEAHFVEAHSPLWPTPNPILEPPPVGTSNRQEYLLRPGEAAVFEWAYGHTLDDWADAYECPEPPNPRGTNTLVVTVFDYFEHGITDHLYIEAAARPIVPVSGATGQWTVPHEPDDAEHGITVYPTQRRYRSEPDEPAAPPWQAIYAAWYGQNEGQ